MSPGNSVSASVPGYHAVSVTLQGRITTTASVRSVRVGCTSLGGDVTVHSATVTAIEVATLEEQLG